MSVYSTIAAVTRSCVNANRTTFSDGTVSFSAGPPYVSYGTFIDDATLAITGAPELFEHSEIANLLAKFFASIASNGEIPIAVAQNGSATFRSAWATSCNYPPADGWAMFVQLLHILWQKDGSLLPYKTYVAAIKRAMQGIPRNNSTHLVTVDAGDEYVSGLAFMEYMRLTGDVANASVLYARACQLLLQLAQLAGDSANAAFFAGEYTSVVAGIKSTLIDPTTGMLWAATRQCKQIDVTSSCMAVFYSLLTDAQNTAISTYLSSNYAALVNASGYILQSPDPWQVVGYINGTGGSYGGSGFAGSQYQGGYWSHHAKDFAFALNLTSPALVQKWLSTCASAASVSTTRITTEWYDRDGSTPGGSTNLESPCGMYHAAKRYLLDNSTNQFQGRVGWQG